MNLGAHFQKFTKPKSTMKNSTLIKILPLAAVLSLFAGCMTRPVNVGPQVATADDMNVGQPTQAPPENQRDIIPPCPGSVALWYFIDGHWDWRGNWVWVPGHWRTRPHPGDIWLRGKWVEQTNTATQTNVYVWQKGHWRSGAPADEESTDR
jgi:hypothetical protein